MSMIGVILVYTGELNTPDGWNRFRFDKTIKEREYRL